MFKNLGTLDIALIIDFATALFVGIYSGVCFWIKGIEPTATLDYFKWLCGGELFATASIALAKVFRKDNKE